MGIRRELAPATCMAPCVLLPSLSCSHARDVGCHSVAEAWVGLLRSQVAPLGSHGALEDVPLPDGPWRVSAPCPECLLL